MMLLKMNHLKMNLREKIKCSHPLIVIGQLQTEPGKRSDKYFA